VALTLECGAHCGIRANAEDTLAREGHCGCARPCHADGAVPRGGVIRQAGRATAATAPSGLDGKPLTGTPMCERWHLRGTAFAPGTDPQAQ
jgi:hypothetical protein